MKTILTLLLSLTLLGTIQAQEVKRVKRDFNYFYKTAEYDETKIPAYTLPDPLLSANGEHVTTVAQWEKYRRPELQQMLTTYMYGRAPQISHALPWSVDTVEGRALKGKAIRKVISLQLTNRTDGPRLHLQVWLPKSASSKPVPLFLGLSFAPNNRIASAKEWQLDRLLSHGYGLATFCYTEVCPDKPGTRAYSEGLMPCYYRPGQTMPDPDQWGSIAMWAWCASRAMDYLQTDPQVSHEKVAIMGHSRLGKTALWAGACDQRFAIVIAVNSGSCGAALSRRLIGETPTSINNVMSTWFCGNFKQFSDRELLMPFDQHEVIALVAPRPIYLACAEDDKWGDPKGEFLAAKAASPVYNLYGKKGLDCDSMPPVDEAQTDGLIAFHIRRGPHAVLDYDWDQFISFADKYLK